MKLNFLALGSAGVLAGSVLTSQGQILYSENFDVDHSANWTSNPGAVNNDALYTFDYSSVGIPSAPHSGGGSTIGLRLRANFGPGTGVFAGISVSPTGQSFTGDYELVYDFWSNFNGNAAGTGSGTTQLTGSGIGTSGTVSQHANSTQSSLWFSQTGDGGNGLAAKDYRVYSSATGPGTGYVVASGVYAAGTATNAADNGSAYYAGLGANTVPAAQTAITATQLGTTAAGAPGFRWHQGAIVKIGNNVTYLIDGLPIATVDASTVTLGGGDIELIQSDINSGLSTDTTAPTYTFGLFDNVVVQVIPEPTSFALGLMGFAALLTARRRAK